MHSVVLQELDDFSSNLIQLVYNVGKLAEVLKDGNDIKLNSREVREILKKMASLEKVASIATQLLHLQNEWKRALVTQVVDYMDSPNKTANLRNPTEFNVSLKDAGFPFSSSIPKKPGES